VPLEVGLRHGHGVGGGKYTVIVWKTRYTPATYTVTVPKTDFEGHISVQNERILHTSLSFR